MVVVAVPEDEDVAIVKLLLVAIPEEHEYEIASVIPTSATLGWQEILATGAALATHCHPVIHEPL